jgi:hypothetical protein
VLLGAGLAPAQAPEPRIFHAPSATPLPPAEPFHAADPVRQTLFQAELPPGAPAGAQPYQIQLEPPGLERLAISAQSDASLQQRMTQEMRNRFPMEHAIFPESPVLSTDIYNGRSWEPRKITVAPNYVVYRRLLFQQINFERYGWDLGVLAPPLSAMAFLWDFVMLPYNLGTDPCRCFDSSAGYCLPGDPVPLILYPPELSLTGAALEVGAILTLVAVFP